MESFISIIMESTFADKILIFTDGACSGNPGPGGFGTIVVHPSGHIEEFGEGRKSTTNNRMEMLAIYKGLEAIKDTPGDIWILTDSTYVIRGITQWIWGWKNKGWKTASGNDVSNQEIWQMLDKAVQKRKTLGEIEWKYVRGHSGTPGNERCDEIAVAFSKNQNPNLYSGSLIKYPVAIHDLPEDMSLPAPKPKKEKTKAHSYLSYVGGQLKRHKTWKECESVVKGRPGAKFKKSTSPEDEKSIVESWGLNPSRLLTIDE